MKRFVWLGFILSIFIISTGCGETYRPVIVPNPPIFPNPKAAHSVISLNDDFTCSDITCTTTTPLPGTAMVVDVSGDTNISVTNLGVAPVHAVQQTGNQILVVNQAAPNFQGPSISKITFSSILVAGTITISLPPNSAPNFVATTESNQAYVTLPGLAPPSVGVVNTVSNSVVNTIPVGNNPVALAETPNGQKLYVANQADNTVGAYNTSDRSLRSLITGFASPVWLNARSDSQRIYVLNQASSLVSTIDTTSTAGPDAVIGTTPSAPNASFMLYDENLNRLYIPGGDELVILDASQSVPAPVTATPILIPTIAPASRTVAGDPCAASAATALNTIAVTALPDGTRAYVGSYYEDAAHNICPQVTVIDAISNTIKTNIAIPGFAAFDSFCSTTRFRLAMASAGDSSRAYLASCDGGNVNIIDTSNDTYASKLTAPAGTRVGNPPQSAVFLIAGP